MPAPDFQGESDLIGNGVKATLVIPVGWADSLNKGDPKPLPLYLDDSDTNTASAVEGAVQKNLGDIPGQRAGPTCGVTPRGGDRVRQEIAQSISVNNSSRL